MSRGSGIWGISFRLLTFNILVVFLPIASLFLMDTYERQLLRAQEESMVQQARLLAAQLSAGGGLGASRARLALEGLEARHTARFRVVDLQGRKLADSSQLDLTLPPAGEPGEVEEAEGSILYRIASFPIRLYRRLLGPPAPPLGTGEFYSSQDVLMGPEIQAALETGYGAATRISTGGQRSVNLYSAIPVMIDGEAVGVVLVSESTYSILQDLYALRLDMFRIFLISLAAAVAVSLVASATISSPLRRLQARAREILDRRGRLTGSFVPSRRRDEIGDLERALAELTRRLAQHIDFVESFASDVSHELKNPLASIRSAAELATDAGNPEKRGEFLRMVLDDVARMERLISGVREISSIDSDLRTQTTELVDVEELAGGVVASMGLREDIPPIAMHVEHSATATLVRVSPDRLTQVLQNIIVNAATMPGVETVVVSATTTGRRVRISVCDDGPGIPPEHIQRVFDRFFTFRPFDDPGRRSDHAGLGLPIARAIVDGYGGEIHAENRPEGGACVVISMPIA